MEPLFLIHSDPVSDVQYKVASGEQHCAQINATFIKIRVCIITITQTASWLGEREEV